MTCKIVACSNPIQNKTHSWCRKHYLRWYKHGDPEYYSRYDLKKIIRYEDYSLIALDNRGERYVKVDNDAPVFEYNWCFDGDYACRRYKGSTKAMHLILLEGQIPEGMEVDHINRDKLDNRMTNLRVVTHSFNQINKVMKNNSSGYRGVAWNKKEKKWEAMVIINKVRKYLYRGHSFDDAKAKRIEWETQHGIEAL